MDKRDQPAANNLDPAGSRVRPGIRRSLRWLMWTGKLPALALAALTGWGLNYALTSPNYRVQVVDAVGVQALTQRDVQVLAAVDTQPIWYVDTQEVAARVRQSPYVQQVHARVVLPNRVEVTVAERKPEVRWMHDGVVYAVTWDGLVVDREGSGTAAGGEALPATQALTEGAAISTTVEGAAEATEEAQPKAAFVSVVTILDTTPNRPLNVGDHVDPDALELARRVSLRAPTELPAPIDRIEWDAGLGVSVILGEGRQAVLGRSDDLDRKMATLRFLLLDNTPFTFLDLRPTTPYYR